MKKFVIMMLATALAVGTLAACTGTTDPEDSNASTEASGVVSTEVSENKSIDMDALFEDLKKDFVATELRNLDGASIETDTGINSASYAGFYWLTEISGLSSEKAIMFLAKDEQSATTIKNKLQTVLESETAQMKDYNAANYEMLQKAVLEQKGLYVYLLISPNVDKLAATVNNAF